MLKSQEFKTYGSIRKTKFGACGVILALAMLGIAFGSNNVSADEVATDKTVVVEKKSEVEVPVSHEKLDKAVTAAKNAGVNVEVGAVQDKGVATSETVAEKKKEIEADYVKQEKEVEKATTDFTNVKADNETQRKAIEAENKRIEKDNAKKEADYKSSVAEQKAFNEKIEKENGDLQSQYDKKLDTYSKELSAYNKQKEELIKKGVKAEKPHITVYGDYDESQRGSVNYYKKMTVSFEGLEGLMKVKDYIGLHADSTISGSRKDLIVKGKGLFGQVQAPKSGDSFTIHNIAENDKGEKISAKFTLNKVEQEWVENGKSLIDTKIKIYEYDKDGSINFGFWNLI